MVRAARKTNPIIFYHVVCEGLSEVFYLERLVQFFNNNGIHPEKTIKPYGPHRTKNNRILTDSNHLLEQAKKIKRNKNEFQNLDKMYILLDKDVFSRGEFDENIFIRGCNLEGITPLFQQNNFEDFIICHFDDEKVSKWETIVNSYESPMSGEEVEKRIVDIIPKYKKGSLPEDIQHIVFSFESLNKAISNSDNKKIPFKSGLVDLLRKFLCG